MTKEQHFFFRVEVERIRVYVQELHFEATRISCVFAQAWCESVEWELQKFQSRIDREVISDGVRSPAPLVGVEKGKNGPVVVHRAE